MHSLTRPTSPARRGRRAFAAFEEVAAVFVVFVILLVGFGLVFVDGTGDYQKRLDTSRAALESTYAVRVDAGTYANGLQQAGGTAGRTKLVFLAKVGDDARWRECSVDDHLSPKPKMVCDGMEPPLRAA